MSVDISIPKSKPLITSHISLNHEAEVTDRSKIKIFLIKLEAFCFEASESWRIKSSKSSQPVLRNSSGIWSGML